MIQYNIFSGGRKKALTFSYDDGNINDIRLAQLYTKYGVKGTFHLNSARLGELTAERIAELRERYIGHEISCHTVHHGWPNKMPGASVVRETFEDRCALEKIAGYPVIGMSYPYGAYDTVSIDAMRACGIVYSRTTRATKGFSVPEDFMQWHPTCHHNGAAELCESFLADGYSGRLFYIWGHSYELRTEEDWEQYEQLVARLAGHEDIWYATNIEIYEYTVAQRNLRISADEKIFYNPSAIDVWVSRDGEIIHIPAGQTVTI